MNIFLFEVTGFCFLFFGFFLEGGLIDEKDAVEDLDIYEFI